jgi:molybdenum cofactor cytidylyltransferase
MKIGIIILAAGSSSRLGQSKQLLEIGGMPLLTRAATVALESTIGPVVVVLGANEMAHREAAAHLPVEIISNPRWETGMGSSLKAGLIQVLKQSPDTVAVIVMVCDQPLLTSGHLKALSETHQRTGKLAVSGYSGSIGVPALFSRGLFPEILAMPDGQGAKKILQQHPDEIVIVNFPEGAVDIDTQEDHVRFLGENG